MYKWNSIFFIVGVTEEDNESNNTVQTVDENTVNSDDPKPVNKMNNENAAETKIMDIPAETLTDEIKEGENEVQNEVQNCSETLTENIKNAEPVNSLKQDNSPESDSIVCNGNDHDSEESQTLTNDNTDLIMSKNDSVCQAEADTETSRQNSTEAMDTNGKSSTPDSAVDMKEVEENTSQKIEEGIHLKLFIILISIQLDCTAFL